MDFSEIRTNTPNNSSAIHECNGAIDLTIMDVIKLTSSIQTNDRLIRNRTKSKRIACISQMKNASQSFNDSISTFNLHDNVIDKDITVRESQSLYERYLINSSFDCSQYSVGGCDIVCQSCKADHFRGEITKTRNKPIGTFSECCNFGDLTNLKNTIFAYPDELRVLFNPEHKFHTVFIKNIRLINSNMSVASLQSVKKVEDKMNPGKYVDMSGEVRFKGGIPIYKIQGTVYHKFNQIAVHDSSHIATNGQLFYVDTNESLNLRKKLLRKERKEEGITSQDLFEQLIKYVDGVLRRTYEFAKSFKMMREIVEEEEKFALENGQLPREIKLLFSLKKKLTKKNIAIIYRLVTKSVLL